MYDISIHRNRILSLCVPVILWILFHSRVDEGMLRRYATIATKPPSRLQARGKNPLGLDRVSFAQSLVFNGSDHDIQFIERQKVISLWRDIVRSTNSISDTATRADMRQFARVEFEQHRHVTDLVWTSLVYAWMRTSFD